MVPSEIVHGQDTLVLLRNLSKLICFCPCVFSSSNDEPVVSHGFKYLLGIPLLICRL
jgi:hypothetical protein